MRNRNAEERCVGILSPQHFTRHVTFTKNVDDLRSKELRNKIEASIALDMEPIRSSPMGNFIICFMIFAGK